MEREMNAAVEETEKNAVGRKKKRTKKKQQQNASSDVRWQKRRVAVETAAER
jgi:hypothetical protein